MRDFRELKVWNKAHQLTLDVYRATKSFPREELYNLTNQIRRAAVSIGANIAEGAGKNSRAEFSRFLQIATGSASELEYHLLLSRDLDYLAAEIYRHLSDDVVETKKMLSGFVQYLGKQPSGPSRRPSALSRQPSGTAVDGRDESLNHWRGSGDDWTHD
ncbi:MAG: four helix bundle protein [Terriglobales bacterium]|jgi:four helix bundle protein